MTDVFMERVWDTPLTEADQRDLGKNAVECFGIYRVTWQGSMMSLDAKRLTCHFRGPDAEAVRIAMRNNNVETQRLWPGTVHDAPGRSEADIESANVLVTRAFDEPVSQDEIQAREDAGATCLVNHRVEYLRTMFSTDRRRMVCLYRAPDVESVRIAQRQADMPVESVWAFRKFMPEPA